ncbi:hypothetical protein EV385_5400 [Krasilnikovia cinnamomea]|uniref:ADP-ribosyltransferase exoenzyme n=1 Tax=Krasilnikovia cinnamomea TaxID=349313 RepID=A0A4Q7ZQR6_9ACTN|nr:hypothetical protein [Krasilnikovia cinnamomea]RZU53472.1 hypothetical protein EV385_5400 [Krasilnikovia cinnamomea]
MSNNVSPAASHWCGHVLLIADERVPPPVDLAARLPDEPDRYTVLVTADPPPDTSALLDLLAGSLPPSDLPLRLLLSNAGPAGAAQSVADALGVAVTAPDGPVVLQPSGAVFVAASAGDGGWWTYRRGAEPTREGPRHPAPAWRLELRPPGTARRLVNAATPWRAGAALRSIPCGVWLHAAGGRPIELTDPAYAITPDAGRLGVLVGRPGGRRLAEDAVYRTLAGLPAAVRERLTLIPYGPQGQLVEALAERLTRGFAVTVETTAGLPVTSADGTRFHVAVDNAGISVWRPVVQRWARRAGHPPLIREWINPLTGRPVRDAAVQRISERWLLEAVPCGLWLRSVDGDRHAVRTLTRQPDAETLIVEVAEPAHADEAWRLAGQVTARLRDRLARPLRLAVTLGQDGSVLLPPSTPRHADPEISVVDNGRLVPLGSRARTPDATAGPTTTEPAGTPPRAAATEPTDVAPPASVGNPETAGAPARPSMSGAQPGVTVPCPSPAPATEQGTPLATEPRLLPVSVFSADDPRPAAGRPATGAARTVRPGDGVVAVPVPARVAGRNPDRPRPALRLLDAGTVAAATVRRSTGEEQQQAREFLGVHYDAHARGVAELLTRNPGLRPAWGEPVEAVIVDLATVAAFVAGDDEPGVTVTTPAGACLVSGVWRLPTYFGAVAARGPDSAAGWRTGDVYASSAVFRTVIAQAFEPVATPTLVIQSGTGRRTGSLSARDEVLFVPDTAFQVIGNRAAPESGQPLVFLRELAHGTAPTATAETTDEAVLESLVAAIAAEKLATSGAGAVGTR